jgi:hypothetical protein
MGETLTATGGFGHHALGAGEAFVEIGVTLDKE